MSVEPKVSVIIPSLNAAEYIRECVESVIGQTLKEIEIICVDAGSTDGTLEILREYETKDTRVKVIVSDKKSYGYQMNLGIDAATGEYFGIVESDDYIAPEMYQTLYELAKEHKLDAVKSNYCIFYGNGESRTFTNRYLTSKREYYNCVMDPGEDLNLFSANNINPPGIYSLQLVRSKNIRLNETPGASFQDNGLWFQIFMYSTRIYFLPRFFYMIRRDNPNSSVKSKSKVYCLCDEYDYIRSILKKDPALEQKFAPVCALYRFHNYNWTLDRVADEFKQEFIQRYARDFRQIQAAGELDERLFTKDHWAYLMRIMNDPDGFYESRFAKKEPVAANKQMSPEELRKALQVANRRIAVLNQEIKDIQSSWTYRIGRFITWLPRKARGGLRCYQEHGFRYTLGRILVHFHLKKDSHKISSPPPKPQPAPAPKPQPVKRDYEYYSKLPREKYEEELELWYERATKKPLDLENPKTFNEKIQWMKLYDSTPIKTRLADKYLVRNWVKEKIGEEYLIPLLGVWDSFDEIDFDRLPDKFVLKANHGSGWNIVVSDKSKFDKADAKKKFDVWMQKNYAFAAGLEMHYMNIPPKIIVEEYHPCPYEYQFWCFHGVPHFISAIHEPHGENKKATYDLNWNKLDFVTSLPKLEEHLAKPIMFEEMVKIAEVLCAEFPFVRVDFIHDGEHIYVGEMTFTPATGICGWNPPTQDRVLGELIQLPQKSPLPERTL